MHIAVATSPRASFIDCEYYGAYQALARMAMALGRHEEAATYRSSGNALREAINRAFWREDAGTCTYFLHGSDGMAGQLDTHQEGGLAVAVLLGVANPAQIRRLLITTHWQPQGFVNV